MSCSLGTTWCSLVDEGKITAKVGELDGGSRWAVHWVVAEGVSL